MRKRKEGLEKKDKLLKVKKKEKNMIKKMCIPLIAALTVSCQNEEDLPVQHPDDYDLITFQAMTAKEQTRAVSGYETYDNGKHPGTMGVFGYFDMHNTTAGNLSNNKIMENTSIEYDAEENKWKYSNPSDEKHWADYVQYNSFDFLAYMPYETKDNVTIARQGEVADSTFTLSLKVVMGDDCQLPIVRQSTQAPLICNAPVHENSAELGTQVHFLFDQTLTGFTLNFQIDAGMAAIRYFRIKSVNIYGDNLANGGTVSRSYTWNTRGGTWTSGDILWSDITRENITKESPVSIDYYKAEADPCYDESSLIVNSDKYRQWGKPFYAIPDASFNPTIAVTYDVEYKDESDNNVVVTRENITSTIVLNKTNFSSLASGKPGHVNAIKILIKPRYLYVLGDEARSEGLLLVN